MVTAVSFGLPSAHTDRERKISFNDNILKLTKWLSSKDCFEQYWKF